MEKTNNQVMCNSTLEQSREAVKQRKFKEMEQLQIKLSELVKQNNREDFYLVGYEYIIRATLTRMIRYYNYDVNIRYDEDLRQEMATLLYGYIMNFEPVKHEYPVLVTKKATNHLGELYEYQEEMMNVEYLDFKELDLKTLVNILITKLRNGVRPYFNRLKSINSEVAISAIIDVDSWGGDFADNEISIMDRIRDKSAELEIESIGMIESLQGTLSKGEYRFLLQWLKDGKQPYKDGKVTRRIRTKLQRQGLTDTQAIAKAIREELYKLQVREHKLSEKLYRIAGI